MWDLNLVSRTPSYYPLETSEGVRVPALPLASWNPHVHI